MELQKLLFLIFHIAGLSSAHFQLYTPVAIGANSPAEQTEGTGPCGGFPIDNRDNVTSWPVGGYPVYMITTHPQATLAFRAALLNDTNAWINVIPPLSQQGVGHFCDPAILGFAPWVGLPAVLQIAQFAPDGINYQVRKEGIPNDRTKKLILSLNQVRSNYLRCWFSYSSCLKCM